MASFTDIPLVCVDCNDEFLFTARDQKFYEEQGFTNQPKRCRKCRDSKKAEREMNESRGPANPKDLHQTVCAKCGGEARVPFKPTEGRPVYCHPCFVTMPK